MDYVREKSKTTSISVSTYVSLSLKLSRGVNQLFWLLTFHCEHIKHTKEESSLNIKKNAHEESYRLAKVDSEKKGKRRE